jgi:hypothetical protein
MTQPAGAGPPEFLWEPASAVVEVLAGHPASAVLTERGCSLAVRP